MALSSRSTEIDADTPSGSALALVSTIGASERELAPAPDKFNRELHAAMVESFANFMQLDVANGEATADTVKNYFSVVRTWLAWCREQDIHLAHVTSSDIKRYRQVLIEEGKAPATRGTYLSIIRRFYEAAVENGVIARNPAKTVKGGADRTPGEDKIKALTEGALRVFLRAIEGEGILVLRARALIGLMVLHGLRRIEVHRLNHESLVVDGAEAYLTVHGKGHKQRRIYLRQDSFNALAAYINAKVELGYPSDGALFVGHGPRDRGHRLDRSTLNRVVDKYLSESFCKKAGVSCHALRHTMGTLAVAGGAKIEHLRDAMGHSKIDTTSIYVRAVERRANNPANFISPGLYDD